MEKTSNLVYPQVRRFGAGNGTRACRLQRCVWSRPALGPVGARLIPSEVEGAWAGAIDGCGVLAILRLRCAPLRMTLEFSAAHSTFLPCGSKRKRGAID